MGRVHTNIMEDLTGKKFGKLVVLKFKERKDWIDSKGRKRYKHYWICKDEAGNEVIRTGNSLRDSERFSKGNKIKDFTEKRIGKLLVLNKVEVKKWIDSKGRKRTNVYWRCRCDCGNEVIRTEHSLREERTRSCGCNKLKHSYNTKIQNNKKIRELKDYKNEESEELE